MAKKIVAGERRAVIYKILNTVTGDFYIGSTVCYDVRRKKHLSDLSRGKHENIYLQNAYKKYNCEFDIFIILECREVDRFVYEQACIDGLYPKYNIATRADAPPIIYGDAHPMAKLSREGKNPLKGRKLGPNYKWRGKMHSESHKQNLRDRWFGDKNPNYGKYGEDHPFYGRNHTEETKKKQRESKLGEKNPMHGMCGDLNHFYGKKHSQKSRDKISQSLIGQSGDKSRRFGKKHSKESREKMRQSRLAYIAKQKEAAA